MRVWVLALALARQVPVRVAAAATVATVLGLTEVGMGLRVGVAAGENVG
jgi:hypothetical protein